MNKYIFSALVALAICLSACAQQPTAVPQTFGAKYYRYTNYVGIDSGLLLPVRDTTWLPIRPAITAWGGKFYTHNGIKWAEIGAGGAGTDTTSLSNRINLKLNTADTSAMLSNYKHWQYGYLTTETDPTAVHIIGTETITGQKYFTKPLTVDNIYNSAAGSFFIAQDQTTGGGKSASVGLNWTNGNPYLRLGMSFSNDAIFRADNVTGSRTLQAPDASGTLALTTDLTPYKTIAAYNSDTTTKTWDWARVTGKPTTIGNNIYTADGTLTGNRQMGGNYSLSFENTLPSASSLNVKNNDFSGSGIYGEGWDKGVSGLGQTGVYGNGYSSGVHGNSGVYGVYGTGNVAGVWGQGNGSGSGILSTTSGGGFIFDGIDVHSSTNTVRTLVNLTRISSTSPSAGLGGSIDFRLQTNVQDRLSNSIISKWAEPSDGSRTSTFVISGVNSGTTADLFTLNGNGKTQLNKYGVGTHTGTPTYSLQVTADGSIIEGALGGGATPSLQAVTDVNNITSNDIEAVGGKAILMANGSDGNMRVQGTGSNYMTVAPDSISKSVNGTILTSLKYATPTQYNAITLPDKSGTVAMLSDISNTDTSSLSARIDAKENTFAKNTAFNKDFGSTAATIAEGNDARFHTHANSAALDLVSGTNTGDQVISDASISLSDITSNDASTLRHGFLPKLPGNTNQFLRADGSYATPTAVPVGNIVRNTSNQTTSSTSLVAVPDLNIGLDASSVYEFEAHLVVASSSTAGNRYGINFTGTGGTISATVNGTSTAATATRIERMSAFNTQTSIAYTAFAGDAGLIIKGIISTGTAGNLQAQFLKVTSGTATVYANSFIRIQKL